MERNNVRVKGQLKQARLEIIAGLYKRGYSMAKIAEEVRQRLNTTCSTRTVWNDVQQLLKEWREARIEDVDQALQLELERIDESVAELWQQWDKSKEDYTAVRNRKVGVPVAPQEGSQGSSETEIVTIRREQEDENKVGLGDVRYIAEIRNQLAERRRLLGLYAPEKRDITSGGESFHGFKEVLPVMDDIEKLIAAHEAQMRKED